MIKVTLKDDEASAALGRLAASLTDLSTPMEKIGNALSRSTKDRMLRGETPDGGAFAPRSPNTLRKYERRKVSPRGGPLDLTGSMIRGIFHHAGSDSVTVGSNAIQAAVMHFGADMGAFGANRRGGPIPWGPIPARPFLGLSSEDRTAIQEIVARWLGEAVEG